MVLSPIRMDEPSTHFSPRCWPTANINGTWTLQITDTNTSAPSSPEFVNFWSLDLSSGQTIDQNVVIGQTYGLVIGGPTSNVVSPVYPTTVPSSPISIGPGLVMASDNTLGSFSPYEGRIYAAFVGLCQRHGSWHQEPDHQYRHLSDLLRRRRPELE